MRLLHVCAVCLVVSVTNVAAQTATDSPFAAPATGSFILNQPQVPALTSARNPAPKAQSSAVRFAKLILPTTIGALAGSIAGFKAGDAVGFGGTEENGLQSAVLLGTGGGLLGAMAGSYLVVGDELRAGQLVHGVAIGTLGGIIGGVIAGQSSNNWSGSGVWLGFSVGQGLVSSFVLSQVTVR